MATGEFILRLLTASIAGLIIGFERQWRQKSAGLRTMVNILLLPLDNWLSSRKQ
ncbi:MAG: MgtC/SapB family protein [Bacteroidales bacterium]|nr:MgtC/SapB family protein [Bacteroidales bacterium]